MICPNCGAEIDEKTVVCPYCDFEIELNAKKEQKEYIADLKEKKKDLQNVPLRKAKKAEKKTNHIFKVFIILFIIITLISTVFVVVKSKNGLKKQNETLAKLEEYYNSYDFDSMKELLDKTENSYSATFEKYTISARLYTVSLWQIEDYEKVRKNSNEWYVAESLRYIFETLSDMKGYEDDGYKYGEEKAVEYFKELYYKCLNESYMLADDEIEEFLGSDDKDYEELAKKSLGRW